MGLLQPLNAVLRPRPPEPGKAPTRVRRAWELLHKGAGRLVVLLAVITIYGGLALYGSGATAVTLFSLWIALLLGAVVWREWAAYKQGGQALYAAAGSGDGERYQRLTDLGCL